MSTSRCERESQNKQVPQAQISFFRSWRGKIFLFALAVAVIPLTVLGVLAYSRSQVALKDSVQHNLEKSSTLLQTI